ncbi:hypothetical protein GCM10010275_63850 [Streptomyces litmocidini]|nr:hypothetical protein GCM10010275_63850 [Streptomyces litmocidini]
MAAPPATAESVPIGVRLTADVEYRPNRPSPYRARVRWWDPETESRKSLDPISPGGDREAYRPSDTCRSG